MLSRSPGLDSDILVPVDKKKLPLINVPQTSTLCFSQCTHIDVDRDKLALSNGKFSQYLCKILELYFSYHHDAYCIKGVYVHDPTALLAAVDPSLFTYTEGVVRVQTSGITRGLSLLYNNKKRFGEYTEWSDKPTVKVAVTVDAPAVVKLIMDRLMGSEVK